MITPYFGSKLQETNVMYFIIMNKQCYIKQDKSSEHLLKSDLPMGTKNNINTLKLSFSILFDLNI